MQVASGIEMKVGVEIPNFAIDFAGYFKQVVVALVAPFPLHGKSLDAVRRRTPQHFRPGQGILIGAEKLGVLQKSQ